MGKVSGNLYITRKTEREEEVVNLRLFCDEDAEVSERV